MMWETGSMAVSLEPDIVRRHSIRYDTLCKVRVYNAISRREHCGVAI